MLIQLIDFEPFFCFRPLQLELFCTSPSLKSLVNSLRITTTMTITTNHHPRLSAIKTARGRRRTPTMLQALAEVKAMGTETTVTLLIKVTITMDMGVKVGELLWNS